MKQFVILSILLATVSWSCKSPKETTRGPGGGTETTVSSNSAFFTVSFISFGAGIDRKAKDDFTGYLANSYPSLSYETRKWGKEGEVDYCFNLTDISNEQRHALIEEAKSRLANSERVRFHEGDTCKH
jgi:hypothetical protein